MPPKKKPDTAGYQKLKKDLADQRPGQLYILHGEETYLRDYYLGRLREQLLTGGMGTFNFHQIEPKDMSPHALEEAIDCLPMMGERTMVQVTDFDLFQCGEKDREGYIKLFSQLPDYVCVVFVYDLIDYKGDARTKLAAAMVMPGLRAFKAQLDPNKVGGTAFIGISRPVIKAHGSSNAEAIDNAIGQARQVAESGIIGQIQENVHLMQVQPE